MDAGNWSPWLYLNMGYSGDTALREGGGTGPCGGLKGGKLCKKKPSGNKAGFPGMAGVAGMTRSCSLLSA